MVRLASLFNRFAPRRVMILGDLVLDRYTFGAVKRISPEAPVTIVHVEREEARPGMVGNVALNMASLGLQAVPVGRIGNDDAGRQLVQSLESEGIDVSGLVVEECFPTPVKNRIIGGNQQMMRIDFEKVQILSKEIEEKVLNLMETLIEDVDAVAISDYGKGFLTTAILKRAIELANLKKIPVVADPKGRDFTKYAHATVIKPNLSEAIEAAGLGSQVSLDEMASAILSKTRALNLMVTRSEAGISIFSAEGVRQDFPSRVREVRDVTGAGDTVLAMVTCALANGLSLEEAARLANVAAGIAVERFGCARVSLSELAWRLLEEDSSNKVFDDEHLFALREALKGKQYMLLSIKSAPMLTTELYREIKSASQKAEGELVVYLRDPHPQEEFVSHLASLREVDFIILRGSKEQELAQMVPPQETIYIS